MFVMSMSEFDQKLAEDENTNRLQEALTLFEEICNLEWFKKTSMLLFLNKRDLLEKKLETVQLKDFFPDYTGANTYDAVQKWMQQQFLSKSKDKTQVIYSYPTTAIDRKNVQAVLNSVKDTVLRDALVGIGVT